MEEEDYAASDNSSDGDTVIDLTNGEPTVRRQRANRGMNWTFTVNNYTEGDESLIKHLIANQANWVIYGKEVGESGTPHLQGYVMFKKKQSLNPLKRILVRAHWETAIGNPGQNYAYCTKTRPTDPKPNEVVVEFGERPTFYHNNGQREKIRWDLILEAAKGSNFDAIPPHAMLHAYGNITRIAKDYAKMPPDAPDVTGIWIQGPSGCGKSRKARQDYPGAYFKTCNKWWDMYQGQENVILDDLDKGHSVLGHHLKIWADRYAFMGETKGSALAIRPKKIIVTTQYTMDDIWSDAETIEALKRRFTVIDMFPPKLHPIFVTPSQPQAKYNSDVVDDSQSLPDEQSDGGLAPPSLKRSKSVIPLAEHLVDYPSQPNEP
jgi:hypothetical protein